MHIHFHELMTPLLHLLVLNIFSMSDLKSGYWQVEMVKGDKEKTAFTFGSRAYANAIAWHLAGPVRLQHFNC